MKTAVSEILSFYSRSISFLLDYLKRKLKLLAGELKMKRFTSNRQEICQKNYSPSSVIKPSTTPIILKSVRRFLARPSGLSVPSLFSLGAMG